MKLIFLLMALMPLVWAAEYQQIAEAKQRSISSQIVEAIEAAKKQMPCGFPGLGIPPMAPLKSKHQDLNINHGLLTVQGEINDFMVYGLDDFDIIEFQVNVIRSRVNFKFNWNQIYASGDYKVFSEAADKGMRRAGGAKMVFKDLTVSGAIKYSLSFGSGKLSLKEMKIYVSLGAVKSDIQGLSKINIINKKLNEFIENWIIMAINDNTNIIADLVDSLSVPIANELLSDKTLSDLLGMIGGSGNDEPEKEPCIPPADFSNSMKYYFI